MGALHSHLRWRERTSNVTGVVFAKGCDFSLVSMEGVWGWVQVGGGGWLSWWIMRAKGKVGGGWGRGVGADKGTGKSMRTRLSKLPFSKLPLSLSSISVRSENLQDEGSPNFQNFAPN